MCPPLMLCNSLSYPFFLVMEFSEMVHYSLMRLLCRWSKATRAGSTCGRHSQPKYTGNGRSKSSKPCVLEEVKKISLAIPHFLFTGYVYLLPFSQRSARESPLPFKVMAESQRAEGKQGMFKASTGNMKLPNGPSGKKDSQRAKADNFKPTH